VARRAHTDTSALLHMPVDYRERVVQAHLRQWAAEQRML
jgi:hypothetical protein